MKKGVAGAAMAVMAAPRLGCPVAAPAPAADPALAGAAPRAAPAKPQVLKGGTRPPVWTQHHQRRSAAGAAQAGRPL